VHGLGPRDRSATGRARGVADGVGDLVGDGILGESLLPAPVPAGMMFLGAADFEPEGQDFQAPYPTAHIPTRSALEPQILLGETYDLYDFDGSAGRTAEWTGRSR